jgi:probable HAF family extracellular repeat protein
MRAWNRGLTLVAIVALAACKETAQPAPKPPLFSIEADPAGLFFTGPDTSLAPANPQGSVLLTVTALNVPDLSDDEVVQWSASSYSILSTGARSAALTFGSNALPVGVESVTVTASLRDLIATRTVLVCAPSAVVIQVSAQMIAGSTEPLAGFLNGRTFTGEPLGAPLTWTSSNPSVLAIQGANLHAAAPGSAKLTASACGRHDTLTVSVLSTGFTVSPVVPTPGVTVSVADMNAAGAVVGTTTSAGAYKNFLWENGAATDLGSCKPRAINAVRSVLCDGSPGPRIWQDGAVQVLDTLTMSPSVLLFNDSSWVASWSAFKLDLWRGPSNSVRYNAYLYYMSDMNDRGEFVVGDPYPGTYSQPLVWKNGATIAGLSVPGRDGRGTAINDSGDVVGDAELGPTRGFGAALWRRPDWQILLLPRSYAFPWLVKNQVTASATDVNNRRDVVGTGTRGGYVWSAGRLTLLSSVVPLGWSITEALRINDAGQILAIGLNVMLGHSGPVLITPP